MKKVFAILCALFSLFNTYSQADSCHLRVSLLTCGPGQDLYSIFGHTGLRVIDSAGGTDVVFNYGTFDDSDPYFYVKFTRGIMIYSLSVEQLPQFMYEYQLEGRSVIEQILQLNCEEKQRLVHALWINAQPANRFYKYGFHTDNCTTRARDIVIKNTTSPVIFKNILPPKHPTFRQLIHSYLDKAGQHWSKLGIDILLGSHLDARASNEQAMFLPDYLMKGFDSALVHARPLVAEKRWLLHGTDNEQPKQSWFTPFLFFTILLVIIAYLSFLSKPGWRKALNIFDSIFFLLLGLLGIVIVTLWAIRVDTVCRNNFNLIWALPTHFLIAFVLYRGKDWVRKYFRIVFFLTLLLALCWWFIPQQLNLAVAPILGLILVRSYQRSK